MKKILALFPSIILYGKERSNYEVFKIVNKTEDFSLSILANKKATVEMKNLLQDFETKFISYPVRTGKFRFIKYIYRYVLVNIYTAFYIIRNKIDCIYLNDEMSVYDFFPVLFLTKAKIVYRIGDAPAFPTLTGYAFNSYMWNKIVNHKVSSVVTISKYINSEIIKYGRVSSINDRIIYNYPPIRKIKDDEQFKYKKNTSLVVGYLGRVDKVKGVHVLVDAAISMLNKSKDISLLIAGSTNICPEYYEELNRKILGERYEKSIHFVGEINNIASFFNSIDVLCVPTLVQEALGNVLVEAKLNSTPVIVFPSGGMPEIVENGVDGYICTDKTSQSIEEVINYYYEDKNKVILHSKNSFESLSKLGIQYDVFQQKWIEVFDKTLR